jgi:NADH-quinone oxidoreductase subunit G
MTLEGRAVSLIIDEQQVEAPGGATIYEAASGAGIHIPVFCHHPKLRSIGACRTCLVEIEGQRNLQTACTTPVREGMIVRVHTSATAVAARRANIEFLLTNHPLDCPVCDKGGECPLQNQALLDGPGQSRYVEDKRHKNKRHPLSEFILLDQERCVLCWRCVRFLDEWADDCELDRFGRGADTRIEHFPGRPLTSKWQGNTIDVCPVGALTSRIFRFEARVWELTNTPSVCPMCAVGCNIMLGVKTNSVCRIIPRENAAVNDAWLCDKGRFAHAFVDHPDRLQVPLIRRDGELQPATWEEALVLIAHRFTQVLRDPAGGPQAIAGLGSTHATNEANYLFQRFMRTVVGTNNVDALGRMPTGATPLTSLPDLEYKDVILLLGCDPSATAPLVELWIKKAVLRRGARVLVANPYRIELARYGGPWLNYRPGSEVILINGLARAMLHLERGMDTNIVRGHAVPAQPAPIRATNVEELRAWVEPYSPEHVEKVTGVTAGALQQAARMLAEAVHPIILYGSGWLQPRAGRVPQAHLHSLANLTLLLGGAQAGFVADDNNSVGALDMGVTPDLYPGGQPVQDARSRNRLASVWGAKLSPVYGLGFDHMMTAVREGNLKALWIMGSDPAHDCRVAGDALGLIPFLVVQDLFLTDTASMAEVVLPTASFAETDGSFTNLTGRVQAIHAAKRPPGQARPDWWIVTELARRMATSSSMAAVSPPTMAGSKGERQLRGWSFAGPASVLAEISRALPGYDGLDHGKVGDQGWQRPTPPLRARRAFVGNDSDSAEYRCRSGVGVCVDPELPSRDPDYPLTLVTGRTLYDRGRWLRCSQQVQKLVPSALVVVHPKDAEKLNVTDGDAVSLVSPQGRLGFTAKVSDEVVPGAVFAPQNLSDAPLSVLYADGELFAHVRLVK